MRIDLHTHSNKSDGTDTPTELIQNAIKANLDVVALTDHDSISGWDEAAQAAEGQIELIKGVEMSAEFKGVSIHLVGYNIDPNNADLLAEFEQLLNERDNRAPQIIKNLNNIGIEITPADVARQSTNAVAAGRPHIADALVELGVVSNRKEAFDLYLAEGMPGYVDRYSTEIFRALELIANAGGKSVIAHPWSKSSIDVVTPETLRQFVAAGLNGIEADHNDHSPAQRAELKAIAKELGVAYTGSSDYHGTGKIEFGLGCNLTEPDQFELLFSS